MMWSFNSYHGDSPHLLVSSSPCFLSCLSPHLLVSSLSPHLVSLPPCLLTSLFPHLHVSFPAFLLTSLSPHLMVFLIFSPPCLLVSSGASVNMGRGAESPLHAAVTQDSPDHVSLLLDFGADMNSRDGDGRRPLDVAPPGGRSQQLLTASAGTAG